MNKNETLAIPTYNPSNLLDSLIKMLGMKNDAALARRLTTDAPAISSIRHRRRPVGSGLLIRMSEESDLPTRDLKALAGI